MRSKSEVRRILLFVEDPDSRTETIPDKFGEEVLNCSTLDLKQFSERTFVTNLSQYASIICNVGCRSRINDLSIINR